MKDKDAKPLDESSAPKAKEKRSGRASFDERGNAVWEWQLETGVYSRDVSTQKLKKLELDELSIADSAIHKRPPAIPRDDNVPGSGFNPYDNTARSGSGSNPFDRARALSDSLADKPKTPERARTPADMRKLSEEIKRKKKEEGGG